MYKLSVKQYEDNLQMQREEMSFELSKQEVLSNAVIESAKAMSNMKVEVKNYEFIGHY